MAQIRKDLIGAVYVDGQALYAGDTVPAGATVGDHVLDAEKSTRRTRTKPTAGTEESDDVDHA